MILRTDSRVKQKSHKNHDFLGFSVAGGLYDLSTRLICHLGNKTA